jgi:methylase of polypeptide subunit release factors
MQETTITWSEQDIAQSALWRSERGVSPPKRVQIADDTMSADTAYKLANEGVGLLWRGDFHNAKHLIAALERRLDKRSERSEKRPPAKRLPRRGAEMDGAAKAVVQPTASAHEASPADTAAAFYRHRQAQAQRARLLNMVLLPFDANYSIALRRAPDVIQACQEAWGPASSEAMSEKTHSVASLRELLGIISAHEWRKKGVIVPALGRDKKAVERRIHAHYGVFSPVRGEYIELVEQAPLPAVKEPSQLLAFDIGTGTGVLSAVLAMRGVGQIVATDVDARALACAKENLSRLVVGRQVKLVQANLFPDTAQHGLAHLIVCNPPWLPGKPSSKLEGAIYDEGSQMLKGFLQGVRSHLAPGGQAWLILSDLAEHLGLRAPDELSRLIQAAGLQVLAQTSTSPKHPKANDVTDPFFAARSREKTHLWRLKTI